MWAVSRLSLYTAGVCLVVSSAVADSPASKKADEPEMASSAVKAVDEVRAGEKLTPEQVAEIGVEMQREVERLRGMKFKRPVDVGLYSQDEVRGFLKGGDKGSAHGWGDEGPGSAILKMVGVLPADADRRGDFESTMMSFVPGGIYDHDSKALRIVDKPGVTADSLAVRSTMAHELVHALDDQHFDLKATMGDVTSTTDMNQVYGAIFEASAVILEQRYSLSVKQSQTFGQSDFDKADAEASTQMKSLAEAPLHVAVWSARFPCGIRFLFRGDPMKFFYTAMGQSDCGSIKEAMLEVTGQYPQSFEQILHPEKYWNREMRDEPDVIDDKEVEALLKEAGLHVVVCDTLGELYCALVTRSADRKVSPMMMGMPSYWTNIAATGWGGDRFFLLAERPAEECMKSRPEKLYGLWLTAWDSCNDRDEFLAAYEKFRPMEGRSSHKVGEKGAAFLFNMSGAKGPAVAEVAVNSDGLWRKAG